MLTSSAILVHATFVAMCGYTVQRNTQSVPFVAYGLLFVVVHEATYLRAIRDREIPLQGAQRRTTHHVAIVIFHNHFVYAYIYIHCYIVRTIYIYITLKSH